METAAPPIDLPRRRVGVPTVAMLSVLYAIAVVTAGVDVLGYPETVRLLLKIVGAVNLGVWAVLDAKGRGRPIPLSLQPWFVLLSGVVVPGYVIYSRRLRGLGWVILHAAGVNLVYYAAFAATVAAAYGPDALRSVEWF